MGNVEINENLIEQQVSAFITNELKAIPVLAYSEFSFSFDHRSFYLRVRDLLVPTMYVNKEGFYVFPTEILLSLNTVSVNYNANKSEEEFFEYLHRELKRSVGYRAYSKRLY